MGMLTSLEVLDLLKSLTLGLLSLLELSNLDLLSELLQVAQLASLLSSLLVRRLLHKLSLDLLHMGILLDHLGEVILGTREGNVFFSQKLAGRTSGLETLAVEGELALQIV